MSTPPNEQLGFDKAPDRYHSSGRETIDLIRDSMTDAEFVRYCIGQVIRYRDRTGLKDAVHIEEQKATWYAKMARHVELGPELAPDPREYRAGFKPYERKEYPWGLHGIFKRTNSGPPPG